MVKFKDHSDKKAAKKVRKKSKELHPKKGKDYYKCYIGDCPAKKKEDKKRRKLRRRLLT